GGVRRAQAARVHRRGARDVRAERPRAGARSRHARALGRRDRDRPPARLHAFGADGLRARTMTAADLVRWFAATPLSAFVHEYGWVWPAAESLHFCGITVLVGTVGAFDLRLLGVGKGFEPAALHRLLKFGIVGFIVAAATGVLFIAGTPDQYFYNEAFHVKAIALAAAGA